MSKMIYKVRGYSEDILVDDSTNSYQTAKDRILELEAENERLREDANRYRKLRELTWDKKGIAVVLDSTKLMPGTQCLSHEFLDMKIDEVLRGDAEGVRKPHETAMYHAAVSIRKHFGEKP